MSYPNFGSWFYDIVTLSQFCRNSVAAKNRQPINCHYGNLNHDLNQSQHSVTELAAHGAALHVDCLLPPLPTIANVNNNKWTDFTAISLPEVTTNEIYTYYDIMWELYTNEKSK